MGLGTEPFWMVNDTKEVVATPHTAIPAAAATLGPLCSMQAGAQNHRQPSLASSESTNLLHMRYRLFVVCRSCR